MNKIKNLILVLILLGVLFPSCQMKHKTEASCIAQKIATHQQQDKSGLEVWQYTYKGVLVYFIPSSGGDQMSTLYDENCQIICRPDGGLMGTGDGKCSDFFELRENGKILTLDK